MNQAPWVYCSPEKISIATSGDESRFYQHEGKYDVVSGNYRQYPGVIAQTRSFRQCQIRFYPHDCFALLSGQSDDDGLLFSTGRSRPIADIRNLVAIFSRAPIRISYQGQSRAHLVGLHRRNRRSTVARPPSYQIQMRTHHRGATVIRCHDGHCPQYRARR